MKKLCSLALAVLLVLSATVAFSETGSLPIVPEKQNFTIVASRQVLDLSDSFNEKIAAQLSEAATNMHIDWVELTDSTERVNLMLASGDLPDAFLSTLSEQQLLKNISQFVALNDLIPTYAPNIKAQYDAMPDMWEKQTMIDGNIYTLAIGAYTNRDNWAGGIPVINKVWLDRVGKAIPTTLDEYYDVLVAIRDGDPNGNGMKDEIPLEFCEKDWCTHILEFGNSWGFTNYFKVENGQYIATPLLPEFREFLEFYHKCAQEGLLDVEGFSQTMQQWLTKMKEDKIWSVSIWTVNSVVPEEKAAEFVVMPPVPAPGFEGKTKISGLKNSYGGNRFGFAITTKCANPEAMLRWFDYQNKDTETKMQWRYGAEGILWERDATGKVWTIFPPATEKMTVENMKYTYGNTNMIPCFIFPDELEEHNGEKYPTTVVRRNMVSQVLDYIPEEGLPIRSVSAEKINERTLIWTDLKAYLDSFVATSIMEGVTDQQWEAHLQAAKDYGIDEYVQWYQDFIDGKF